MLLRLLLFPRRQKLLLDLLERGSLLTKASLPGSTDGELDMPAMVADKMKLAAQKEARKMLAAVNEKKRLELQEKSQLLDSENEKKRLELQEKSQLLDSENEKKRLELQEKREQQQSDWMKMVMENMAKK
jgi:hypothetical protein